MSSFVQTYTGKPFFPLDPSPYLIDIEDIAHSLSMLCRYNGHVRRFYSVAEHCVVLSHTVDPEHARWALLHDAAEAYIGDMVWPLKEEIPEFKQVEAGIMGAICARFDLDPVQPEQVTEHDRRIVIDERDSLMALGYRPWPALEGFAPLRVTLEGWDPARASSEYLSRFQRLFT
jgi:uncharacterized protein